MTKLAVINGASGAGTAIGVGGGVWNEGALTAKSVRFDGNLGHGIFSRAKIYDPSYTVSLSVDDGLFTNNCAGSGGAIEFEGAITVKNSIFDGNRPVTKAGITCLNGDGAAIHTQGSVNGTIDKSTFINNVGATGAITSYGGSLVISNSTFTNNKGVGGQYNDSGTGAIYYQGINAQGGISLINSTITNNQGVSVGGISRVMTVKNSIIANNVATSSFVTAPDCHVKDTEYSNFPLVPPVVVYQPVSGGNNIFGTMLGCKMTLAATDFVGSPGLAAVTLDATTGQTYFPLLASSQAIDRAASASCSTYDQLGKPRPRDGNNDGVAQCDIGAFEKQLAQVANVCPSGCAYTSIQAALNAAAGATITVGPGTYNEALSLGAYKTLLSTHGAQSTILNGAGLLSSTVSVGLGSTIDGFTIENNPQCGVYSNSGTVLNNVIRNNGNITTGYGGVYTDRSNSIIKNNSFINNKAQNGGAINAGGTGGSWNITIENNTFLNNQAYSGGAIALGSYNLAMSVSNNVFKGNIANVGAALSIGSYGDYVLLANNLVVGNTNNNINYGVIDVPSYGKARVINNTVSGNTGSGIIVGVSGNLDVTNSIVRGNSGYEVAGGWYALVSNSILGANSLISASSANNIYADPMFVGAGDYRVRAGSPAIDRGKNMASSGVVTDLLGVLRPQDGDKLGAGSTGDGSDYDIGAYEFK